MEWLPPAPATQVCSLDWEPNPPLLVLGLMPYPLNHTDQGTTAFLPLPRPRWAVPQASFHKAQAQQQGETA